MSISFTTTHDALSAPLETIRGLHTNRPPVPALGLIRLEVNSQDEVTISAYDYQTCIRAGVKTEDVDGLPGQLLLDRTMLSHIVKSFAIGATAKGPIRVQEDGGTVVLSAGDYRFVMPINKDEADNFPELPVVSMIDAVDVDRKSFVEVATRLLVCAGSDMTLPMLTGIYVETITGGLQLAATDRFRLGVGFVPTTTGVEPVKALLPAKPLAALLRHMPDGDLTFGMGKDIAWVTSEALKVSLRPLDNEFVKYRSLIPQAGGASKHTDALVPRKDLAVAVKQVAAGMKRGHHVRLQIAGGTITVTAGARDEPKPIPTVQDGEDLGLIAFNPQYIGPALASFSTPQVAIRYSTPARPIMFAEPGQLDNEQAFRTLVMPARLPG